MSLTNCPLLLSCPSPTVLCHLYTRSSQCSASLHRNTANTSVNTTLNTKHRMTISLCHCTSVWQPTQHEWKWQLNLETLLGQYEMNCHANINIANLNITYQGPMQYLYHIAALCISEHEMHSTKYITGFSLAKVRTTTIISSGAILNDCFKGHPENFCGLFRP